jgi:DNA-binding GntR family transcriptional regulator
MGKKIVGKSLQTEAYEKLEEMIVTQALAPATTVTEQYLSELIGIGRTPIREALQRLAREGLVLIRPRSAILILEMSLNIHHTKIDNIEWMLEIEKLEKKIARDKTEIMMGIQFSMKQKKGNPWFRIKKETAYDISKHEIMKLSESI